MNQAKRIWRSVLLLSFVVALGCSSDRLPTYPVQGRVVFADGSPVRTGSIELKSNEFGVQARGNIAGDGSFQLTTYEENDGAVAGTHQCVVVQLVIVEELSNFKPSTEGVVDPRFGSYSTSELECHVSTTDDNNVTLTVEPLSSEFASDAESSSSSDSEAGSHKHVHDHTHNQQHREESKQK